MPVAVPVLDQLQPTPTATGALVGPAPAGEPDVVAPTPTPIGGGGAAPLLFISNRGTNGSTDIYQINPDGSGLGRLTDNPSFESQPRWSPP